VGVLLWEKIEIGTGVMGKRDKIKTFASPPLNLRQHVEGMQALRYEGMAALALGFFLSRVSLPRRQGGQPLPSVRALNPLFSALRSMPQALRSMPQALRSL